jgi:maltose O-acetyltransferase
MSIRNFYSILKTQLKKLIVGQTPTHSPAKSAFEQMLLGGLSVGNNFIMLNDVILDPSHYWHISIGDDVTLAPRVHVLAHDASTKKLFGYTRIGRVTIGDRVFIGASSIILPGVTIGNDTIIGAGSVVSRNIPSNSVAAGNPARVICTLEDFKKRRIEEFEHAPKFGEDYTMRSNLNLEKKHEMNQSMEQQFAYVI